jgi:drug/metabolite transporter (DMT)-like permease
MAVRRMGLVEWALLAALATVWGGSFFFVKVLVTSLDWPTVVLLRIAPAALALVVLIYAMGHRLPTDWPNWRTFLVMGLLNNVAPFSFISWGQLTIDSGLAAILNATTPLFAVLLAHVLTSDERLSGNRVAGVVVGILGVVVLIGPGALAGLGGEALAQGAIILAALCYGLSGIYGRRLTALPVPVAATGMLVGSAVIVIPLALVLGDPLAMGVTGPVLGAVLGLSLLSTALAYLIYFQVLKTAGATNLLLVTFLVPIGALVLGGLFLGERPGWTAYAGLALILCGLAAVDGRLLQLAPRLFRPSPQ